MPATLQDFESQLVLAQQGDKTAQGEILDQQRAYLRLLALRQMDARLGGRIDASDIVHETYVTALTSFKQFRGSHQPAFLAWLRTVHEHVVQNQARWHIRRLKRTLTRETRVSGSQMPNLAVVHDSTPSRKAMQGELIVKLIRHLDALLEDQRDAIRLRYCEGLSLEKIAVAMNRSPQSVAGLLKRGLETLRAKLTHEF